MTNNEDSKKETKTCSVCKKTVDTRENDWTSDVDPLKNPSGVITYWHLTCRASDLETNEDIKS